MDIKEIMKMSTDQWTYETGVFIIHDFQVKFQYIRIQELYYIFAILSVSVGIAFCSSIV
jgi:hypothetical protein